VGDVGRKLKPSMGKVDTGVQGETEGVGEKREVRGQAKSVRLHRPARRIILYSKQDILKEEGGGHGKKPDG